jgi:hypothetical protein
MTVDSEHIAVMTMGASLYFSRRSWRLLTVVRQMPVVCACT